MKVFFLTVMLVLFSSITFSQTRVISSSSSFELKEVTMQSDTLYNLSFEINLQDTINIKKVNVKVGSSFKGNEIFDGDYIFYPETGEQSDTKISRDFFKIKGQNIETIPGLYFYTITVEDFQGVKATPFIKQQ